MRRELMAVGLALALGVFALAPRAEAWGCYHAGYSHYGYGGYSHAGVTVSQHPAPYASSRQSGTFHYGGTTVRGGYYRRW